jgi:dephospho-CoA kinase
VVHRTSIPVVGFVGGIGSGKSSLVQWIASRQGDMVVINGDEVGHEVLKIPAVRDEIRAQFGDQVLGPDGQIDRKVLGRIVFGTEENQKRSLHQLERIVHPRIRETFEKRIADAAADRKSAVLLDAAVLFEAGWNDLCHLVVYVDVPRDQRVDRLRRDRGWSDPEIERRESSQLSLETKRSRSQFIVDNSRSLEDSGRELEQTLSQIARQVHS